MERAARRVGSGLDLDIAYLLVYDTGCNCRVMTERNKEARNRL